MFVPTRRRFAQGVGASLAGWAGSGGPTGIAGLMGFTSLAGLCATPATAQSAFPRKPVTIVVPYAVGGSADLATRLVAAALAAPLGQPVVVDNRAGAGGTIGWSSVARAQPDGYTLLAAELSLAIAPGLVAKLPFDARKSFSHIVTAVQVPHVLVVNPAVPARTVAELIALAKARPGKLFYGSGGNGTNTHLAAELFKDVAGDLDIGHVPYKGAGAVLADLIGGQVQMLITSLPTALPHIQSGKLRALLVLGKTRSKVLPDVPSAVEAGLPKLEAYYWVGFAAPAGTPAAIIAQLNQAMVSALNSPEARRAISEQGLEVVGNTPEAATRLVNDEMDRWAAVVRQRDIRPD